MRILIAPDKFKGSLTASEAASAIAEGVRRVYPKATVIELPIADGGEGTLAVAYRAGYEKRLTTVIGPTDTPIEAEWALRMDASGAISALIETARASGLEHIQKSSLNSLLAHSYGCGQLITAALDAGATEVIVGLGGSAMSDGGMGAMRALGLDVLDSYGSQVPLGGGSLSEVAAVDASGLDSRLAGISLRLAVDVRNPLHGPNGAAHVFGPQKGASPSAVSLLDSGLRNWAAVLSKATGREADIPGAGAAGGFPAPFLTFTHSSMESGFGLITKLTGLVEELTGADLVITGEGSVDVQSLEGKAPIALAETANLHDIPVLMLAGRIMVSAEELALHGVTAAAQLLDHAGGPHGVPDVEDAVSNAALYLRSATARLLSSISVQTLPRNVLGAGVREPAQGTPCGKSTSGFMIESTEQ
jgi:glycerate kinase